jgi:hypothetical protein
LFNLWTSYSQQKRPLQVCDADRASQQQEVGADYDDPRILDNMIYQAVDPTRDPTHVQECMVYRMGQEVKFLLLSENLFLFAILFIL